LIFVPVIPFTNISASGIASKSFFDKLVDLMAV